MRRNAEDFAIEPLEEEREWTAEEFPVLRATVSLPHTADPAWRRLDRFYRTQSRAFLRFCKGELLPWAEASGRAALSAGTPPVCCTAELTYRTTYRAGNLWSLCTRLRENAAPGPAWLAQWGDTWDLSTGYPVPVSAFFPPHDNWRKRLLEAAGAEIRRQEEQGVSRFRPDWRRALRKHFRPRKYYLTEEGAAFFYPMCALAPAAEGIPVFTLPYDEAPPLSPRR